MSFSILHFGPILGPIFTSIELGPRTDVSYDLREFSRMFDLSRISTHSCQIEFHRLGEVSRKVT